MIPLRDLNPSTATPVVTRSLIALNLAFFFYELALGPGLRSFIFEWGLVPARLSAAFAGGEPVAWAAATLVTSMFLHGGWMHVIGNLWYLWIFGDNVEDRMGPIGFLLFYLASGVVAALLQFALAADSAVPTVGASGAIAGVLGAYLAWYPRARVVTLVPLFPFFQVVALPAVIVLGLWFVFQFFSGALSLGMAARATGGGIAWWAHVGGFVFGLVTAKLLPGRAPRYSE